MRGVLKMGAFVDLTGQRFGRLHVLKRVENARYRHPMWSCCCDCDKITVVRGDHLRKLRIQSCGCLARVERVKGAYHNGRQTPEYRAWAKMKDRCLNTNNPNYKDYGGRGIKFCNSWHCFENFCVDVDS